LIIIDNSFRLLNEMKEHFQPIRQVANNEDLLLAPELNNILNNLFDRAKNDLISKREFYSQIEDNYIAIINLLDMLP